MRLVWRPQSLPELRERTPEASLPKGQGKAWAPGSSALRPPHPAVLAAFWDSPRAGQIEFAKTSGEAHPPPTTCHLGEFR